jgi:hypothetical protein
LIGAGRNAAGRVEIAGGDLLMTDSIAGGFLSTILVGISGGDGALRVSDGGVSAGAIVVGANFEPASPTVPTAGVAEFVRSTVDVGTADAETSFSTVGFEGRGELRLVDSTMNVHGSLGVGSGFLDPAQEGLLELTRSILGIDGGLFLGEFSRLLFNIEGLARESEYGAIDTGTGTLNGVLDIRFAFTPAPGTHVFDLIVADTASGGVFGSAGLAGVFDSVILSGLGAGFGFAVEYVPFASDPALTRIVRLTIAVPEPAPWALVLLAALALTFVLRRRQAGARAV